MSAIHSVIDVFNAREQATFILVVPLLALALWKVEGVRGSIAQLAKQAVSPKLLTPFVIAAAYSTVIVWGLSRAGLWHVSSLKRTIYWFLGSAVAMIGQALIDGGKPGHFRGVLKKLVAITVVIEFLVGFYVFPLWAEIFLLPFMTILVLMNVVAIDKPELAAVKRLLTTTISLIGIAVIAYAVKHAMDDPGGLFTRDNAEDFGLPIVLGIALLPLLYVYALLGVYEPLFMRIGWFIEDGPLRRHTKRRILTACNFRLNRVSGFSSTYGYDLSETKDESDVDALISRFRRGDSTGSSAFSYRRICDGLSRDLR